jgi:hypothetical protein
VSSPIRITAHAIGAALDFNEIDAEDKFVDAPSYDALAADLADMKHNGYFGAVVSGRIRALEAALLDLVDYTDISKHIDADAVTERVRRARVVLGLATPAETPLYTKPVDACALNTTAETKDE